MTGLKRDRAARAKEASGHILRLGQGQANMPNQTDKVGVSPS
jgi:hypothetical protein